MNEEGCKFWPLLSMPLKLSILGIQKVLWYYLRIGCVSGNDSSDPMTVIL